MIFRVESKQGNRKSQLYLSQRKKASARSTLGLPKRLSGTDCLPAPRHRRHAGRTRGSCLTRDDPLEEERAVPSGFLRGRFHGQRSPASCSRPRRPLEEEKLSADRSPGLPCPWPAAPGLGGPAAPGSLPSGRPGHRSPPRPRSAHGARGVLARGAGGEVAATKVRGSPLELSGPARPVSSTGRADPGLSTCEPPPSRDTIPGDAGLLGAARLPGTEGARAP